MSTVRYHHGAGCGPRPISSRSLMGNERRDPASIAIFGHGNVTCLSEALEGGAGSAADMADGRKTSSPWRSPPLALPKRRRRLHHGPVRSGLAQHGVAAGVAHANRLPAAPLLAGDTFVNCCPYPVMQQVEHFGDPSVA